MILRCPFVLRCTARQKIDMWMLYELEPLTPQGSHITNRSGTPETKGEVCKNVLQSCWTLVLSAADREHGIHPCVTPGESNHWEDDPEASQHASTQVRRPPTASFSNSLTVSGKLTRIPRSAPEERPRVDIKRKRIEGNQRSS